MNSEIAFFAAILYASVGFYLGVNIPAAPYKLADGAGKVKLNPVKLLSAIGTLLAASAALVSVCAIIFDASPVVWIASQSAACPAMPFNVASSEDCPLQDAGRPASI